MKVIILDPKEEDAALEPRKLTGHRQLHHSCMQLSLASESRRRRLEIVIQLKTLTLGFPRASTRQICNFEFKDAGSE